MPNARSKRVPSCWEKMKAKVPPTTAASYRVGRRPGICCDRLMM